MWRRHFIRNLRTAIFIAIACSIAAGIAGLWWTNRKGLPESWRAGIEEELGNHGLHLTIDSLSYFPFKGLIANNVRIFADKERLKEIARLERIVLDVNKSDLARKRFRLTKIELSDARLSMPLDPLAPDSTLLEIADMNGSVLMPGGRLLEIRDVRGKIGGIEMILDARLLGYQPKPNVPKDEDIERKRRELIARIVRELRNWTFEGDKTPVLRIYAEGDVSDKSTLEARISLNADGIEKNGHRLDKLSAEGMLTGNLLTLNSLLATDSRGDFEGRVDYDIKSAEGRFDVVSGIEVPRLLKAWFGLPAISQVSFAGRQTIEAEGDFHFNSDGKPKVRVTGNGRCESVMIKGTAFDAVESAFAWRDGILYLRDVLLARKDGSATGKALIQGPLVQIALKSTLPTKVLEPFFQGQVLGTVISDFGKLEGAKINVEVEGGFDSREKESWAYTGRGQVDQVTFRGVPVAMAKCGFSLSHHGLDFFDGTVTFNYDHYPLQDAFGGPNRGTTKVARVRYDPLEKWVAVDEIEGTIWAAPMVRLFAPKIADGLEAYRFHHPPALKASGVIDVSGQGRTSLSVGFRSEQPADYKFLGENLTLAHPSGEVVIRGDRVTVNDLKTAAFGGPVAARFNYSKTRLGGELSWSRVDLSALGSTYDFQIKGNGSTTGRMEFTCDDGKIRTLDGSGLLALEKTELFSVPMFGPLSSLVAGVLGNKRAGYERARDAFMNFEIRDGILTSRDFRTTTSSLVFTGDGKIDLATRNIDMTVRMNARGFLKLITLPLQPFYGLFQFHGTGPMKSADWNSELFTAPPDDQKESLLSPPKARAVEEP